MKISTLRENITGSEKNCRNKYVHETRSGKRYLDSGIDFVQGWCVFEGTPSYDEHWMYGCKGFTVGEFMQAVENGLIKTELTDETKEKLREFENYGLGISVLLYCFPDDFDLPFKFCHRLLWSDEWEYGGDITQCVYYFHNTGRDDYTRSANNCKPMHLKRNRLKTIDMNSNDGVKSTDKMLSAGIPLDPIFTFDNYVVGENNRFAVEAAKLIADSRSTFYTPLFIYGNHGLGKTHLAQAIGNRITEKNPYTKVIYTRSIKFIDDFIEALSNNTMPVFKSKYGSADVLIVEDVQYFQNKESLQEHFYYTLCGLLENNRQIIITADMSPDEMKGLIEELNSMFKWGLVAEIKSAEYETRMAILETNAELLGMNIDDDLKEVLRMIAENIKMDTRELKATLKRLKFGMDNLGWKTNMAYAKEDYREWFRKSLSEADER